MFSVKEINNKNLIFSEISVLVQRAQFLVFMWQKDGSRNALHIDSKERMKRYATGKIAMSKTEMGSHEVNMPDAYKLISSVFFPIDDPVFTVL